MSLMTFLEEFILCMKSEREMEHWTGVFAKARRAWPLEVAKPVLEEHLEIQQKKTVFKVKKID